VHGVSTNRVRVTPSIFLP